MVVATPFLWTGCGLGGGVNGEFEGPAFRNGLCVNWKLVWRSE